MISISNYAIWMPNHKQQISNKLKIIKREINDIIVIAVYRFVGE